jgi:hypothetical protein
VKAFLSYLAVAIGLVSIICAICQFVYDGDNFYHLGHAIQYRDHGPLFRPFPWVTYSVISQHNSDLWWGFHVLLVPITWLRDRVLILAVAPGFLLVLNFLISRLAVMRLGMNHWYGLVLVPASTGYFTRMDTVRPQALSASLLVLVFAAIVSEAPWLAILTSVLIGLLHPTLSYLILMVGFCTFIQRGISSKKWNCWTELSCLVVALSVSSLRPGMIEGLQLMKIQLWDLMLVRRAGEVRNFGIELEKVNLPYFYRAFLSPLILLIVSLVCLIRFRDREKPVVGLWGSVLMVAAAFILSAVITRRGVDQFAPFSVLTCLLVFRQCKNLTKFAAVVVGLHAVFVVGAFVKTNVDRVHPYNAADYRDATAWLAKNTAPGEIVGQSVWSDFGPLFYWDPHNRFLGGMDPIFQYKFDPGTYWLMTLNAQARDIGKSSKYNPAIVFDKEEELSRIYPREFKTKWLFCAADWNKEIQDEIKKDPHTKVAYRDSHAVIYEFLPH